MTKKLILFCIVTLTILFVGCSTENPLAIPSQDSINDNSPINLAKKVEVPIKGSYVTTIENLQVVGPGLVSMNVIGKGLVSHLGNSTVFIAQTANYTTNPLSLISPTVVFTAANGDELHSSGVGTFTDDGMGNSAFTGTLYFDGGTGRFSTATGSVTYNGSANVAAAKGQFTFEGIVKY